MNYRPRLIADKISHALDSFPVVVLAGARQTGKSMLLRNDSRLKKRPYFTCDDPQTMLSITAAGEEFLQSQPLLNLDEAQRAPQLFLTLKRIVDNERQRGRFLITGSAQFLLLRNLGDSLAGRAGYIRLFPACLYELRQITEEPALFRFCESNGDISHFQKKNMLQWDNQWLVRGGYPEPAWVDSIDIRLWCEAYEATYIERDIRELAGNLDPLAFQRFLRIAASWNGSLLNQANIARDAGLNNVTCGRYIHLLEVSGLLTRIYPYFDNAGKRYVKSPKILFTDTTLAAYLAGMQQALDDEKHPYYGRFFESFVMQNLLALTDAYIHGVMKLYHLRTTSGFEIDAIIELNGNLTAIEIKSSHTVNKTSADKVIKFIESQPNCTAGIVAYRGDRILPLGKNVWAVPVGVLLT